jgi:hypothetical protein
MASKYLSKDAAAQPRSLDRDPSFLASAGYPSQSLPRRWIILFVMEAYMALPIRIARGVKSAREYATRVPRAAPSSLKSARDGHYIPVLADPHLAHSRHVIESIAALVVPAVGLPEVESRGRTALVSLTNRAIVSGPPNSCAHDSLGGGGGYDWGIGRR